MTKVVCGPDSYFADDVRGHCAECSAAIVWRPHWPADVQKVCIPCHVRAAEQYRADGKPVMAMATPATIRELALYLAPAAGGVQ